MCLTEPNTRSSVSATMLLFCCCCCFLTVNVKRLLPEARHCKNVQINQSFNQSQVLRLHILQIFFVCTFLPGLFAHSLNHASSAFLSDARNFRGRALFLTLALSSGIVPLFCSPCSDSVELQIETKRTLLLHLFSSTVAPALFKSQFFSVCVCVFVCVCVCVRVCCVQM